MLGLFSQILFALLHTALGGPSSNAGVREAALCAVMFEWKEAYPCTCDAP